MDSITAPARASTRFRERCRRGDFTGCTAVEGAGFVQANLMALPGSLADEFARFCASNPAVFPVLATTRAGNPRPGRLAGAADLRTDLPAYHVFRGGVMTEARPEVAGIWREDLACFLTGCSFTFDSVLRSHGIPVRHMELGKNIAMYETRLTCRPEGSFRANIVVSMRPFAADLVPKVREISGRYPLAHGRPVHVGDPAALGIDDLERPDYGDSPMMDGGEVPMFWPCGVTGQLAIQQAKPDLCITHAPGAMFVSDLSCEDIAGRDSIAG